VRSTRLRILLTGACALALVAAGRADGPRLVSVMKIGDKAQHNAFTDLARLPAGRIRVEICEDGVPKDSWPGSPLAAAETYAADAFGFFQVPHKYIDTGVRADRSNPYLLRAAALVDLPAGTHRLLLRGHGACRLFVDGILVLATPFPPPITDGHSPIPTDYLDLGPTFRFAPPGNRDAWTPFTSSGKRHLIVLETIVGGRKKNGTLRPDLGETVVAVSPAGAGDFHLLAPRRVIPYTDAGWDAYAAEEATRLAQLEAARRAAARQEHAEAWDKRRAQARHWLAATPEVSVPPLPAGYPAFNAIDHFLAEKLAAVAKEARRGRGSIDFVKDVRPILEARCYQCHQGRKARGGLRLDTPLGAFSGGDSGEPAVRKGEPAKSVLLARVTSKDRADVMPPEGARLSAREVQLLRQWVEEGASWSSARSVPLTPLADDLTFLRRVTLDTVGLVPTYPEIQDFLRDSRPDRRARLIDRLLADSRWADHWVGYWQDVLAENPSILNPTLNNSGPFRWWLHEALLDNKPLDLFVTELVWMRGSLHDGGPAGFAMASENDVPLAEKGAIVAAAFLGIQMKCARCHDAPAHSSTQKQLFQLAALLKEEPLVVPKTSSVPQDKLHGLGRKPLIAVTLKPGTKVEPAWPFGALFAGKPPAGASSRERLAALLTDPENERFAEVIANRVWQRLMGRGLVEPVDDWENAEPSHPELVRYLGRELVRGGYDIKHLARLILNTHAYQRGADPALQEPDPLYAAPARRRLTAEQIVDSLFLAAGKTLETEEISLDIDSGRDIKNSLSLGKPRRAWQLASTSNERDRPSLSLPRVQAVVDVLEAFGWRSARQDARTARETAPNVLQPAILANGPVAVWLTRLSEDHGITHLALEPRPVEDLVERLFLKILTRGPRPDERAAVVAYLRGGYESRRVAHPPPAPAPERRPPRYVSWSNHLTAEANQIKIQLEGAARRGAPPTTRLEPAWRQRLEDVVWALLNAPEFVFTP
jgi:hypothetical protein